MFCSKCGANNKDGVKFCSACGAEMVQSAFVQPQANVPTNSNMPSLSSTPINPYTRPQVPQSVNPYAQPQINQPINPYAQPQAAQTEGSVEQLKSMAFETRMSKKKFLFHPANEKMCKTFRMEMIVSWVLIGLSIIMHLIPMINCIREGEREVYFPSRFWAGSDATPMPWMSMDWVFINEYIGYVIIFHVVMALLLLLSYYRINIIYAILFAILSLVPLALGYVAVATLVICAILFVIHIFTINKAYGAYFRRGSI